MSVVSEIAALATRVGGEIKAVRSWVTTQLAGKANTAHAHAAADTTTGTFALARIPTGTTSSTVALGDHAHSGYAAGLTPTASRTASHTATPGEYVMADASSGAFTVTLPATGSAGVKKTDTSANLVTVAASSGKTLGTLGAASIPLRLTDQAMITQVSGNNHVITHGYQSLAALDGRYPRTSTVPAATRSVSANTTAVVGESLSVSASGAARTISQPATATAGDRLFVLKNDTSTNTVALSWAISADAQGVTLWSGGSGVGLWFDGTNWWVEYTTTPIVGRSGGGGYTPPAAGARAGAYDPASTTYLPSSGALRLIRGHLARAATGSLVDMVCTGDSRTVGNYVNPHVGYPSRLRALLAAEGIPIAGTGLVQAANSVSGAIDTRITTTGSWAAAPPYRQWTASGATATFTSANDTTFAAGGSTGTVAEVWYVQGSGTFTITIDGTSQGTITPAAGSGIVKWTSGTLSDTTHTITVTATSAAGSLVGFCLRRTTGLLVHSVAQSGHNSTQLAATGAGTLQQIISFVAPSVLAVMIGTNDPVTGVSAATHATNLATILATNNAGPAKLLLVTTPADGQQAVWPTYVSPQYDQADTLGLPLIDLNDRFGSPAAGNAAGLIGADLTHETTPGMAHIARTVSRLVTS